MPADELSAVAEPIEQTPAAQPIEGEGDAQETAEQTPTEEVTGDGRTLPAAIKALKGVNNDAYEAAKRAFFAEKDYAQQFPGGVKEAREIMQYIAENGGREGIAHVVSEAADFQGLTQAMTKGDVGTVLDRVSEVAPDFFAQAAPDFLSRFYQAAPEQCNQMLCGVVAKSLNDSAIPQALYEATMAMRYLERVPGASQDPSFAELKAAIEKITGSVNAFSQVSAQAPQQRQQPNQQPDRDAQYAERERQQTETHYLQRMTSDLEPKIASEARTLGYELNERQLGMLYKEVMAAADKAVGKDGINLIRGHLQKNDVANAVKTAQSRYGLVLAEVVKKEAAELFRMPTKAKPTAPAVAAAQKPTAPKPQAVRKSVDPMDAILQKAFA